MYDELKSALKLIDFYDVMPLNTTLKAINGFYNFAKYCLFPFIVVEEPKI
jgi:hypothetical protein